jgi:hypothetical protein
MQTNRLYTNLGIVIRVIGIAAFVAGRIFNSQIRPVADDGSFRTNEFTFSTSNNITPAPELPSVPPEVTGLYVERKDNTFVIQAISLEAMMGLVYGDSSVDVNSASKVEIVLASRTDVYRDITPIGQTFADEGLTIQQLVEESILDDLNPPTMITVWGDETGDMLADILLYSNSLENGKP